MTASRKIEDQGAGIAEDELVLVIDGEDMIEISTAARIAGSMIPICKVEIGYEEPMESLQHRYASQLVRRFNSHNDLLASLKALITGNPNDDDTLNRTINEALAAIARAEGRS